MLGLTITLAGAIPLAGYISHYGLPVPRDAVWGVILTAVGIAISFFEVWK